MFRKRTYRGQAKNHTQKEKAVENFLIFVMNFNPGTAIYILLAGLCGNVEDYKADVLHYLNF